MVHSPQKKKEKEAAIVRDCSARYKKPCIHSYRAPCFQHIQTWSTPESPGQHVIASRTRLQMPLARAVLAASRSSFKPAAWKLILEQLSGRGHDSCWSASLGSAGGCVHSDTLGGNCNIPVLHVPVVFREVSSGGPLTIARSAAAGASAPSSPSGVDLSAAKLPHLPLLAP